jgi:hypothetical protein
MMLCKWGNKGWDPRAGIKRVFLLTVAYPRTNQISLFRRNRRPSRLMEPRVLIKCKRRPIKCKRRLIKCKSVTFETQALINSHGVIWWIWGGSITRINKIANSIPLYPVWNALNVWLMRFNCVQLHEVILIHSTFTQYNKGLGFGELVIIVHI